jgi:hypothetical protein
MLEKKSQSYHREYEIVYIRNRKKLSLRAQRAWQSRFEIAEPVPSKARNPRVCFGFASQPLLLLATTYWGNVNYYVLLLINIQPS